MMFLLKALILWAPVCFGCSQFYEGGCQLPSGHQPNNEKECHLLNLSQENAVSWFAETSGKLDVSFLIHDVNCGIICYKAELYVYETYSEQDCRCNLRPRDILPHSRREYAITKICPDGRNCHQTCGKTGLLTFQYVFSGCYQLVLEAKTKNGTHMKSYSCGKYLTTNYSKKLLAGTMPRFILQYSAPLLSSEVAFDPLIYNHLHSLDVKLRENIDFTQEESYYKTGHDHSRCFIVNNTMCHCISEKSTYPPPQCFIKENIVYNVFRELIPGNYNLFFEVIEDRCLEGTIWTKSTNNTNLVCRWSFNFTIQSKTPFVGESTPGDLNSNRVYIILAVVSTIVVAVIIVGLVALRTYVRQHRPRTALPLMPSSVIPTEPSRIFLLYARDCQPFMVLMATLREVLEDATKCEVIDCLDSSRWNEIARSPMEWVRSHIEQPNTKVVLVATHCAYLRQQALMKQVSTHYKEPGNFDNLFIYGLTTLMENLSQDVYRKVSVTRFEGFSDDGNLFGHLTPYTRFVLPLHLHKLVNNLHPSALAEQTEQLTESKDVQKLSQDLTQLINYKNKNMNYLQDILTIQRNDQLSVCV